MVIMVKGERSMKIWKQRTFSPAFIGVLAIAALLCLVFVSCPIETDPPDEINSQLDSTLKRLPANTADNPHTIILSVSNLRGIRGVLNANLTKYVYLDLSGSTLTSIGDYAFSNETTWKGCTTLVGITIPDSVTSIGEGAFIHCNNLANVTIGNSVASIGNDAFSGCTSLMSISVPAGNQAYSSADGILYNKNKTTLLIYPAGKTDTAFTIPDSVTSIERDAFSLCASITSITIPNSVITIKFGAFQVCQNLASVTMPDSVISIGDFAFHACTSLASVIIGSNITGIGGGTFYDCTSLVDITIPDSVTNIGYSAFYGCRSLASIAIPDSVTNIGNNVFIGCASLMSIAANNSVYSLEDGILYNKNKTILLRFPEGKTDNVFTIPNSVTSIERSAFQSCRNLASITIPNSVTSIGNYAFFNCPNLATVIIGNGVTSIGIQAFDRCPSLASVTFHSIIPSNGFPFNGSSRAAPPPPPPTFPGDLVTKYLAVGGGIGTYARTPPSTTWTKQP
jgi:hypothetical protein